MSNRHQS